MLVCALLLGLAERPGGGPGRHGGRGLPRFGTKTSQAGPLSLGLQAGAGARERLQAGWLVLRGAGGDSGTHGGSSVS
ncbi:hypothetical protein VULLAG_LOCUS2597 [Vulpes lagopus]